MTTSPRDEYRDFTRSLRERALAGEKLSVAVPPPLQSAAAAGQLPEQVAPVRPDEGFLLDPSQIDWDRIDMSAWEAQLQQVEPDDKIILMMQQGMLHHILPHILAISDADIRARLLSLLYYVAEFEFAGRFSYYIPRWLLSGNSIENVQRWAASGQDLVAAHSQMLDALLEYISTGRAVQLQAASAIAAAALDRHQLSLVKRLSDVLA